MALWPNLVALNIGVQVMNALMLPAVLGVLAALAMKALPHAHRPGGPYLWLVVAVCTLTGGGRSAGRHFRHRPAGLASIGRDPEECMRNVPFEIRPIAGALGAELRGVDLAAELPDATIAAIRQALLDHLVIFFRDQDLPPERFLALARRFGTPIEYPFVKGIEGFPEIINVAKLEHETVNFGGVWHSDTTYLQEPPMATLLVAREVPEAGGDTLFANQYLAYETLSEKLRGLLAGLRACPVRPRPMQAERARTASAPTAAPRRASCWRRSIRWYARIRRPDARRSMSIAHIPSASPA